jgi:hypothetical protein
MTFDARPLGAQPIEDDASGDLRLERKGSRQREPHERHDCQLAHEPDRHPLGVHRDRGEITPGHRGPHAEHRHLQQGLDQRLQRLPGNRRKGCGEEIGPDRGGDDREGEGEVLHSPASR